MSKQAFSHDGYIIDQRQTKDYPYGRFDSSYNGCGWIAAYNLLHASGSDISAECVNQEMSSILPRNGWLGTTRKMLMRYLTEKEVSFTLVQGRSSIIEKAQNCHSGILRYIDDGRTPHIVTFIRIDEAQFRFFNSVEGDAEDCIYLPEFFDTRVFSTHTYALLCF